MEKETMTIYWNNGDEETIEIDSTQFTSLIILFCETKSEGMYPIRRNDEIIYLNLEKIRKIILPDMSRLKKENK